MKPKIYVPEITEKDGSVCMDKNVIGAQGAVVIFVDEPEMIAVMIKAILGLNSMTTEFNVDVKNGKVILNQSGEIRMVD